MWWWLAGCGDGQPKPCDAAECAALLPPEPPVAVAGDMPAWEAALVGPLLADAREGVRPWDERGIGVCRGQRTCEEFLGTEAGELAPGDYLVRAELRVPELGPPGTWTVAWQSSCEVVSYGKDGAVRKKTETTALEQPVRYAGPGQGWRIEPLIAIHSPTEGGTTCTWSLEARQPSGPRRWTGSWSTPAAGPPPPPK
jgi:hypothetical protein